ncbi:hypothetical protein PG995_004642 [Apiospora arundinis]
MLGTKFSPNAYITVCELALLALLPQQQRRNLLHHVQVRCPLVARGRNNEVGIQNDISLVAERADAKAQRTLVIVRLGTIVEAGHLGGSVNTV